VSGVVLAGGQSRRMGRDKAFIDFAGVPLVARVIERIRDICYEVIIVTNNPEAYRPVVSRVKSSRIVGDVYPGKGSLGGIFSGLRAATEEHILAVACDMPFLNQDLMRYMISLAPGFDVVIAHAHDPSGKTPRGARGNPPGNGNLNWASSPIAKERDLHPMHAVYSKRCIAPIEERLRADDLRAIGFHDSVSVRVVEASEVDRFDPLHWSFFNVNTPEDLKTAQALRESQNVSG
jgi:molybdenum cofactor guanylyltransferase